MWRYLEPIRARGEETDDWFIWKGDYDLGIGLVVPTEWEMLA